ncbi:hypothetical protein MAH1_12680 [Sessilibacter sp. MAH1]
MYSNGLIVVSNKFENFTRNKNSVTVNQLMAMLELPEHIVPGPLKLFRGQGISDQTVYELVEKINKLDKAKKRWDDSQLKSVPDQATSNLSHKRISANTLICEPQKVDQDTYTLVISIDENSELMCDHQTGQHIQGMILIEATRQAFLAVTEKYFLDDSWGRTYFVINSMKTDFKGFVFPVGAHINYKIVSKDLNEYRKKFQLYMEVIQSDQVRMTAEYSIAVYPESQLLEKEAKLASDAANFELLEREQEIMRLQTGTDK